MLDERPYQFALARLTTAAPLVCVRCTRYLFDPWGGRTAYAHTYAGPCCPTCAIDPPIFTGDTRDTGS